MRRFSLFRRKQRDNFQTFLDSLPTSPEPPGESLGERLAWLRNQLDRCADVVIREITTESGVAGAVLFLQGMVDRQLFEIMIENDFLQRVEDRPEAELAERIGGLSGMPISSFMQTLSLTQALQQLLNGQMLMLIDGLKYIQIFLVKKTEKRAITEPTNEPVIRGPRESFVEDLETNITMIRRRIRHPALKTERLNFGTYTQTDVMLVYIDGICKQELVDEVKLRLGRIKMDGVLGTSYLEEYIEDNPYSPFPQLQATERPDTVTASLLEGRIAIFADGSPIPVLAPVTLNMFLQSAEDYYQRYIAATWIRWIRYFFLLISLLLPSVYVAVTTFHPEMLPPNLLLTVAAAREGTPFPAFIEAMLMEITFEALREGGLRIPKTIGQTISIIGALIIGQAAVEAGIVSAPMVIIVSLTGIASFVIPNYSLGLTLRLLRFPIMLLAGTFGMFGIVISLLIVYMHLLSLRSFGTPYMTPIAPIRVRDWKDVMVRAPWWKMSNRPVLFGTRGGTREAPVHLPHVPKDWDGD
ncbi:spore germination protein [Cohnella sp. CFH 77786]|uniref:spore germination protein n=1 Tax=Cohnella sp. CFH 77786 TaxID=2662265 RepID=UPI001C60FA7C|nr:spore germination protein [Cohnella sp. CFH 77786]MBW5447215.1 spore germination protein [Cohnella sp. CFH 77786]